MNEVKALLDKEGVSAYVVPSESGFRVVHLGDDHESFSQAVNRALKQVESFSVARASREAVDHNLIENNWQEQPGGEGYFGRLSSERPEVVEAVLLLAQRVEDFNRSFAREHGLPYRERTIGRPPEGRPTAA